MIQTSFNSLDIAFFGLILLSCIVGVLRGVTREVLGIVGWVGAVVVTLYSIPFFHPMVQQYIANPTLSRIVTGVVVFIIALSVLMVVSKVIAQNVKSSALGGVDRSLGLLFGVARGVVLGCILYLTMTLFWLPKDLPDVVKTAHSTPWVKQWSEGMQSLLPPSYQTYFKDHHAKEALQVMEDLHRIHSSAADVEATVEKLATLHATIKKDSIKEKLEAAAEETAPHEDEAPLPRKAASPRDFLDELLEEAPGDTNAQ